MQLHFSGLAESIPEVAVIAVGSIYRVDGGDILVLNIKFSFCFVVGLSW